MQPEERQGQRGLPCLVASFTGIEMNNVVYLKTEDNGFAQTLSHTLREWNLSVIRQEAEVYPAAAFLEAEIDVVVLDIRQHFDEAMNLLRWLRGQVPGIEVITLNTVDRVAASMAAMRAGAADELTVPLDIDAFKKKVLAACRRRRKSATSRSGGSIFAKIGQSMAAATFAQAGEFETAMDLLNQEEDGRKK